MSEVEMVEFNEDLMTEESFTRYQQILVKPVKLSSGDDLDMISEELKEDNILLVNLSPLQSEDPEIARGIIDQLKGVCTGLDGDMAAVSEDIVLVVPSFVRIEKTLTKESRQEPEIT
jgi:SepF-like predicted cell division protein (DUF552 family)